MTETGRVALITGGSRGIGAAAAVALAEDGCSVVISYRTRTDDAERVVQRCRDQGVDAAAVRADVTVPADIDALFATAADLGQIRAVINNAGVVPAAGRVESFTPERLDALWRVNITGAFLVAGAAVRAMSTAHGGAGGVLINVSSRAAVLGAAGEYVDYAASKAAIDALTTGLAAEVADQGVRVVGVRPGLIDTDIHAPGRLERLGGSPPLGRPGRPEEVAAAIAFLTSDSASYVTGATLDVSGGR